MSGRFADRLSSRRITLAIILGVLAFLFAVEAKTAWYAPFGVGDVQSAKAIPSDAPNSVSHKILTVNPLHSSRLLFSIFAVLAASSFAADAESQRKAIRHCAPSFISAPLSPLVLFRPPPAL